MKVRLPNGLTIHAANRIDARFIYHEIFVQECYLKHGIELLEGARVFDVGANIGMFALFVSRSLRDFELYAFEPIPETFELLRRNAEPLADKVKVFNMGLSDHSGTATFTRFPRASALATCSPSHIPQLRAARNEFIARGVRGRSSNFLGRVLEQPRRVLARALDFYFFSGEQTIQCPLKTLSEIISTHVVESIDLLKIDVENSEWEVLAGLEDADWARVRQVVLEVHDIDGRLRRVLDRLERVGFDAVADQDEWGGEFAVFNVYARRRVVPLLACRNIGEGEVGRTGRRSSMPSQDPQRRIP
ncbi:FkbM family methyltransferase [Paludisphaera rhizosphaerae]|uniref:FkbM family methyltransferase n=1 Tax=Paludisphaera rhizosphaerae TaxID=2711216 RepID=UPI0013EB54E4|nr:FkbM family methyltransferase [Paludisphaera rhizosphaerae]